MIHLENREWHLARVYVIYIIFINLPLFLAPIQISTRKGGTKLLLIPVIHLAEQVANVN